MGTGISSLKKWFNGYWLWAAFVVLAAGAYLYVSLDTIISQESPSILNFFNVFGSLLFSALLVALYGKMSQIQDRQTTIMDSNLKPVLTVTDREYIEGQESAIRMNIENKGNGIASDIAVEFLILCYDSGSPNEHLVSRPNEKNTLRKKDGTPADISEENDADVLAEVYVGSEIDKQLDRRLTDALTAINNGGDYDYIYYQIVISYSHLMSDGERRYKFLLPYRVPFEDGLNVEKMLEKGANIQDDFSKFTRQDDYDFMQEGTYCESDL